MPLDLIVPPDCPALRLDQFVTRHVTGTSRRNLRHAEIRLNGRLAKHATKVQPGDVVSVPDSLLSSPPLEPNPALVIPVLYADAEIVAVDKPAGLSSVARSSDDLDTVANFLLSAFPEVRDVGDPLEGGLVHRLDHDTSGVLLAARTPTAHVELRRQFSAHEVEKQYVALVLGDVSEEGTVDLPIAHDPRRSDRMIACADEATAERLGARPASTEYAPVVRYQRASLLRISMRSGVRHQVRVHLAAIEHPIAGDRLYGPRTPGHMIARQALHASRVRFRHPGSGETMEVGSPLPREFEAALKRLRP